MDQGQQFFFDYGNSNTISAFNEARPATATARQLASLSIPMDLNTIEKDNRMYSRTMFGLPEEHPRDVYLRKYEAAKSSGLVDHILKHGLVNPIRMVPNGAYFGAPYNLEGPLLYNGQHRAAVMLRHRPDAPIKLDWGSREEFEANPKQNKIYNTKLPIIGRNGE
jgi:hypothetical protein